MNATLKIFETAVAELEAKQADGAKAERECIDKLCSLKDVVENDERVLALDKQRHEAVMARRAGYRELAAARSALAAARKVIGD